MALTDHTDHSVVGGDGREVGRPGEGQIKQREQGREWGLRAYWGSVSQHRLLMLNLD